MEPIDFGPATRTMAGLLAGTRDDQLSAPTPCPDYRVADLLDHIGGLTVEFIHSARQQPSPQPQADGDGDGAELEAGWRDHVGLDLATLAASWAEPAADEGTTHAGPIDLPAPEAARVALNELVVHGWDLARATGQACDAEQAAVAICIDFVESFDTPANDDGGLFGPPVDVGDDADPLDRLVGLTGRDPNWTP